MMRARTKSGRRAGRRRLAAGWVFLVLAVMSFAAWVGSIWVETTWSRGEWTVQCGHGVLAVYRELPSSMPAFRFVRLEPSPVWWIGVERRTNNTATNLCTDVRLGICGGYHLTSTVRGVFDSRCVMVLLYPFAIAAGICGVLMVRSGRRARRVSGGLCERCGYDLAGLGAGVGCPECGKAMPSV
ncbi:MAG: hypothetical protein QM783_03445 [Phycisphaerales bacterium]